MFAFFGGGGETHGKELGYAEIISEFDVDDATLSTIIDGLTFNFRPMRGTKYYLEFYSDSVEENSGITLGDVMLIRVLIDDVVAVEAFGINGIGGIGSHIHAKSSTRLGDGVSHTITADVRNRTTGTNGAIVDALTTSPTYIRAIQL